MAIDPNPFICDICGTHKKETNHWWLGLDYANGGAEDPIGIAVVQWDTDLANTKGIAHLCGIGCATTWAGRELVKLNP